MCVCVQHTSHVVRHSSSSPSLSKERQSKKRRSPSPRKSSVKKSLSPFYRGSPDLQRSNSKQDSDTALSDTVASVADSIHGKIVIADSLSLGESVQGVFNFLVSCYQCHLLIRLSLLWVRVIEKNYLVLLLNNYARYLYVLDCPLGHYLAKKTALLTTSLARNNNGDVFDSLASSCYSLNYLNLLNIVYLKLGQ